MKLRVVAIVASRRCNVELWIASAKVQHFAWAIRTIMGDGLLWWVIMRHVSDDFDKNKKNSSLHSQINHKNIPIEKI